MNEATLIFAFELLDDFLTEGKSAPVWLVVGGGSALLVQRLSTREYGRNLKISLIGRKGLIPLKLSAALDRDQRRDIEDLAFLKPTSAEVEDLLRWVLRNIHESPTYPKLPSLLQELGHADLIPGFS